MGEIGRKWREIFSLLGFYGWAECTVSGLVLGQNGGSEQSARQSFGPGSDSGSVGKVLVGEQTMMTTKQRCMMFLREFDEGFNLIQTLG